MLIRQPLTNPRQLSQQVTESEAQSILAKQRLQRPISPHLTIYRPQITWVPSALHRITGSVLSGAFYLFGAGYLVAPLMGWHLGSQALAASFAAWPVVAKVLTKMFFATPFVFHSINGLRHLVWDFAKGFGKQTVSQTGWITVGLTAIGTLLLVFAV